MVSWQVGLHVNTTLQGSVGPGSSKTGNSRPALLCTKVSERHITNDSAFAAVDMTTLGDVDRDAGSYHK